MIYHTAKLTNEQQLRTIAKQIAYTAYTAYVYRYIDKHTYIHIYIYAYVIYI